MITPLFTLMLLLFTFDNAAVPATSGFIAEFYIRVAVVDLIAVIHIASIGIICLAFYILLN